MLLLTGTELAQVAIIAEACRACVESLEMPRSSSKMRKVVTVSAGVTTMVPGNDTSRKGLVEAADKTLWHAKWEGRNRVAPGSNTTLVRPLYTQA